jgi:hypothetical protein
MQRGSRLWAVALVVLGVGLAVYAFKPSFTTAQQPEVKVVQPPGGSIGGPKYTVIDTQGTNLLVVDNATNTLFYYTVDPDKQVGDELKLRGSLDLNLVGKPSIKPVVHKAGGP